MIASLMMCVSVLLLLVGMLGGIVMGMQESFLLAPAHAHLNLVGWLSLAVMGGYYAVDRGAPRRLGWLNFIFSALGATVLPLGIALVLTGHEQPGEMLAMVGGMVALLGMATFAIVVLGGWRRAQG